MARDLYGEMLSRALNRGAPPGHFPAYINPGEAAQLREQGGGVPPGGGQYVANGLPSYQSTADWQAMAEALGSSVETPSAPGGPDAPEIQGSIDMAMALGVPQNIAEYGRFGPADTFPLFGEQPSDDRIFSQRDVRDEFARQRELARAREVFQEQAAAPRPDRVVQPDQFTAYEQERLPTGFSPPEQLPWRQNPNLLSAELAQRTAKAENARALKIQEAAVAKVEASYGYIAGTPEGDAERIRAMNENRLPHSNTELSAFNFEVIINNEQLTARQMADRLSANISEGGTGRFSPVAGAADRAEKRGYGEDPNLKDILRSLTLRTPEGDYAVMGGGVSMPKELIAFGPALAGSVFGLLAPPALGALSWAAGAPGISQWLGAKYPDSTLLNSRLGDLLTNPLGMRGGEERALPEIDLANIRRLVAGGRTVGAPDFQTAVPELAPVTEPFVSSEGDVEGDGERTLDPISQTIQDRLAASRSYGADQRADALALLLNPTQ